MLVPTARKADGCKLLHGMMHSILMDTFGVVTVVFTGVTGLNAWQLHMPA